MAIKVSDSDGAMHFMADLDTSLFEKKYNTMIQDLGKTKIETPNVDMSKPEETVKRQKQLLQSLSGQYRGLMSEALSAFDSMDKGAQKDYTTLSSLREQLRRLNESQRDLAKTFQSGSITQKQYLEGTRALSVQQNAVKQRISETSQEIRKNEQSERQAIGSIAEKTAKLTQLRQAYIQLSEAQRRNENVGGKIKSEFNTLQAEVGKLNQELGQVSSRGIGGILSKATQLAGVFGIAFGVQQLISFGMELFNIARQAEGVQYAFSRMSGDSTQTLLQLRSATKGTVADLELMKVAVRANNFKIPMDVLAKGLTFAKQRADDTGQSVDYMVNSFVDGIGRKSKLVLDNLGISASELSNEIEKTGDFAAAAGNIIERSMADAGEAVDTFGNRIDRASSYWENMKLKMSGFFADLFVEITEIVTSDSWSEFWSRISNWGNGKNVTIAENLKKGLAETEDFLRNKNLNFNNFFGDDKNITEDMRKKYQTSFIEAQKERQKAWKNLQDVKIEKGNKGLNITDEDIAKYQKAYDKANQYYTSLARFQKTYSSKSQPVKIDTESIKSLKERLKELEGEKELLTNKEQILAKEKEISKLSKQIADLDGTTRKKTEKRGESEGAKLVKQQEKDNKERIKLLDQWAQADANYNNKQLSRDDQEVASIKQKYAEIKKAIEDYNKTTKAKKISLDGFDNSVTGAVKYVRERQSNDKKIKLYQGDYSNFIKYEDLKKQYGAKVADEQLGQYKSTFEKIAGEYAGLQAKQKMVGLTANEEAYYKELEKLVVAHGKRVQEENLSQYLEALKLSDTYNDQLLAIEKKYQDAFTALGENASKERKEQLRKALQEEVSQLTVANIQKEMQWDRVIQGLQNKTKSGANKSLDYLMQGVNTKFKLGKLSKKDYDDLTGQIDTSRFEINLDKSWIASTDALNRYRAAVKAYGKDSDQARKAQKELFTSFSEDISKAQAIISSLDQGLQTLGISGFEEVFRNVSGILDGAKDIASGNPIGMITGSIKLLSNAINLFNTKDKKLQKQIDAYKTQLDSLGKAYDKLQGKLNDSDANYYENQVQTLKNLDEQEKAVRAMMKAEDDKKKTDKDKMKAYRDQLDEIDKRREDVEKAVRQMRLQTDINSLSQSIADALLSAFEAGEDGIESMDKAFDKFIKNALVNSLRIKMINPIIEDMVNKLDEYMSKNDNSISGFNFDFWKDRLNGVSKTFNDAMENAFAGLGLEKEGSSSRGGGLKGSIQRELTEATASELTGLFRASFELQKKDSSTLINQLNIATSSLSALNSIQVNTAETVKRLDSAVKELQTMNKNLGGRY
ncbi:Uncharacterised protein [Sphingobacterium multivorum]|uniref:hypothetical protein n=1 Tax=Sphingobacterium multivorum TaxID=28454 RepID=UPI000E0721FB|nr:hypothetical protein [Sphingobacterium multivorum]QQT43349.1 hypothetical protein I6J00_16515 [Sphingobacterium multivorum]SUI98492.1 Uncharacterised protein [Sphingobacterium multivorum]